MKRLLFLAVLLTPASAPAVGIVTPVIIVINPDQPADTPTADDDPLKTIERITTNARAVGDRLQNEDSGTETQKTQDQLLKDIDSLLKTPPPMGGGGGGGGGGSPPPPMPPMNGGGGGGGGMPPPKGGQQPPPMGQGGGQSKRPRGDRKDEQPMGGKPDQQPMGAGNNDKKEPMGAGKPDPMQPPMDGGSGGKDPSGGQGGVPEGKARPKPDLPLDDPFTRRVWGHLPEKVRQQAMQSYREQFMPRYSELLKQYYSTLNDKQTPNPAK